MNNREEKILKDFEAGYDQMAEKFSGTRKFFWRDFEFVQDYVKEGDKILDFGCGNGRFLEMLKNKRQEYFGVDVSQKLIDIAKEKYAKEGISFQKISSSDILPFPDNFFNKVVSVSVFHHFPEKYAEKMVAELWRIINSDGIIIISVWNLWQRKYLKYIFSPIVIIKKIFQKKEFKGLGIKDGFIPFKDNQGNVFNRYHHAYSKRDLKKIFEKSGFEIEKCLVLNQKNILIIGKKQ